jgi:hypothetical protein
VSGVGVEVWASSAALRRGTTVHRIRDFIGPFSAFILV